VTLRFLLDTHVLLRWLFDPKKLSREQTRVMREAERRGERVALSGSSLIEIAIWANEGRNRADVRVEDLFAELEFNPILQILPITIPIAVDAGAIGVLRDPADRTIVATARVHRLRLLTSDQRIVNSRLVSIID